MTLDELESTLWGAAVLLRGKINATGYKEYGMDAHRAGESRQGRRRSRGRGIGRHLRQARPLDEQKPAAGSDALRISGGLLWKMLGAKTIELVHKNVTRVDIDDQVVRIIRTFSDAFATIAGKREIRQQLRSILWLKYQIKDQDVFEKAYNYVEQYY